MLRKTLSTAFLPTRVLVSTGFVHRGRGCELQTGGLSGVVLPPMHRKRGHRTEDVPTLVPQVLVGLSDGS